VLFAEGFVTALLAIGAQTGRRGALFAAAPLVLFGAARAAEEELIAVHVGAVVVVGALFLTVMADADQLFGVRLVRSNGETVVKNEELALPMGIALLLAIADHSAIELKDVLEPLLL